MNVLNNGPAGGLNNIEAGQYRDRLVLAGDFIEGPALSSLDQLITTLKTAGVWTLLDEAYVFWGHTAAGQAVKLKYASGNASSLDLHNFVDADCADPTLGFGPGATNTTKYALTGYVPSAYSRTYQDFIFGASPLGKITESGNGMLLSDQHTTDVFQLIMGPDLLGNYSSVVTSGTVNCPGLWSIGFGSGGAVRIRQDDADYYNATTTSQTYDHEMGLWRASFNSSTGFAQGRMGFAFMGGGMTDAQQRALGKAVRDFETAVGRRSSAPRLVSFGDSTTAGVGATNAFAGRWSAQVAASLGLVDHNIGVPGSFLVPVVHAPADGFNRYLDIARISHIGKVAIMYGTNDAGSAYSSTFGTEYDAMLAGLIAAGVPAGDIIVCSMVWSSDSGRSDANQSQFAAAAQAAAAAHGCPFVDVYAAVKAAGGGVLSDTIHPNDSGYTLIANTILAAL